MPQAGMTVSAIGEVRGRRSIAASGQDSEKFGILPEDLAVAEEQAHRMSTMDYE
jgi:hypothetical protein